MHYWFASCKNLSENHIHIRLSLKDKTIANILSGHKNVKHDNDKNHQTAELHPHLLGQSADVTPTAF